MAFDLDLEQKRKTGDRLTSAGIIVLVVSFFGTCAVAVSKAGEGDPMARGSRPANRRGSRSALR
jgi:hypothetical protein